MPTGPAARIGDMTAHGSPLAPGPPSPNVLIGGQPAWRGLSDFHACPIVKVLVPDVGGVVVTGSTTVLINGLPAARMGDTILEGTSANVIAQGCPTVIIGDAGVGGSSLAATPPLLAEAFKAAALDASPSVQINAPAKDTTSLGPVLALPPAQGPPTPSEIELAESEDSSPEARAARDKVARNYYRNLPEFANDPAAIQSHVDCIDLNKPVKVVQIPEGSTVYQHSFPGQPPGQYFAPDSATTPDELGISSSVLINNPDYPPGPPNLVLPRQQTAMKIKPGETITGLQSTAAPANDRWSLRGRYRDGQRIPADISASNAIKANGGGTQIMIPASSHSKMENR